MTADYGDPAPPVPGQLQRYEAELRLRLDDVEASRSRPSARSRSRLQHGGSVASPPYDAPAEGIGAAQITLRVPTARVQSAIAQLSELGTILRQRYGIEDLQPQADSLQTQIEQTQRVIAQLVAQLAGTTILGRGPGRPAVAAERCPPEAGRPARGPERHDRRGAHGTIYLTLTTEEIEPARRRARSRLDDIRTCSRWEAIALLYVLVVAGPFLLLGLLVWFALRLRRRRSKPGCSSRTSPEARQVQRQLGPHGRAVAGLARDT